MGSHRNGKDWIKSNKRAMLKEFKIESNIIIL